MSEIGKWFGAGSTEVVSSTLQVPKCGGIAVVGFNMEEDDVFVFEAVIVAAERPDMSCCMPQVQLPKVVASTPLNVGCCQMELTACNNMIYIDQPAGFYIRAIRKSGSGNAELHYVVKHEGDC